MRTFARGIRHATVIASLLVLGLASAGLAQSTPVEGAWVVTSWEVEGAESQQHLGLFLFTKTHYSIMYTLGNEPRAQYAGETPTATDRLAAYGSFIANSGRYSVNGNELTTRAFVAKDPNYMGGFPDNEATYTFRIEDGVLHLDFGNGYVATARQVDDQEM